MMDFDVMPPRQGTRCEKWDGMSRTFGEAAVGDVIPLSGDGRVTGQLSWHPLV